MEFHPLANGAANGAASSPSSPSAPAHNHKLHPGKVSRPANPAFKSHCVSAEQIAQFDRDGFLLIKAKDFWSAEELALLLSSAEELGRWADAPGKWMKYYETNRHAPQADKILCRIENFVQYNDGMNKLLNGDKLVNLATDLFGEQSILYKEKINYKLPGGDGFAAHQDVAAGWWMYGQTLHLSCLVSIDAATAQNGCLEVCRARHRDGMLCEEWKAIPEETVQQLQWESVPTEPGDVLFFDSYVPHKSAPNNSNLPRRVLYATYAKASEGDFRDRYYADKRQSFPPDCEREAGKVYEYKI